MARLVLPPRSKLDTIVSFPRQAALAIRLYRLTPARLRRAEPALRLGLTVATAWFGLLFITLGAAATRTASTRAALGYYAAAVLGCAGLGLFVSRRPRIGLAAWTAMLVIGQAVAIASMMSA